MTTDPQSLSIVRYPDPILRSRAPEIDPADPRVRGVAHRMIELMHEAEGIGLAAPQVGLPWRLFVAHVPPSDERTEDADPPSANTQPLVFINPTLSEPQRDLEPLEEGCLSIPGITGEVRRPSAITVTAHDLDANQFTLRAAGLLARCIQHEFDHLEGVLILDRMTYPARLKNKAAIRDLERRAS